MQPGARLRDARAHRRIECLTRDPWAIQPTACSLIDICRRMTFCIPAAAWLFVTTGRATTCITTRSLAPLSAKASLHPPPRNRNQHRHVHRLEVEPVPRLAVDSVLTIWVSARRGARLTKHAKLWKLAVLIRPARRRLAWRSGENHFQEIFHFLARRSHIALEPRRLPTQPELFARGFTAEHRLKLLRALDSAWRLNTQTFRVRLESARTRL